MNNNEPSLSKIRDAAILFGLKAVQTRIGHLGTGKEKLLFEIRDSLIYRSWAVSWHLSQMPNLKNSMEKSLQKDFINSIDNQQALFDSQQLLHYLFDDVIFNLSSMFDYIGNLVGITYLGPKKSRLKWNGVMQSVRDENNIIFSSPVKDSLTMANSEWVNHILKFRGDNIHHKLDQGSSQHNFNLQDARVNINVYAPESITKRLFKGMTGELEIINAATMIADGSADYCIDILKCMTETLEPDCHW